MRLLDKLKAVFQKDDLWWMNAEEAGSWNMDQMEQAARAADMEPETWECYEFLTNMDPETLTHAAWIAGYIPPHETAEDTKMRYDYKFEAAKHEIYNRGFQLYYNGGLRSQRVLDAVRLLAEDKWIPAIPSLRKAGYVIEVPAYLNKAYKKAWGK